MRSLDAQSHEKMLGKILETQSMAHGDRRRVAGKRSPLRYEARIQRMQGGSPSCGFGETPSSEGRRGDDANMGDRSTPDLVG